MMQVKPAPEPTLFPDLVQKPGHIFLGNVPNPTQKEWNGHSYWRRIARELHEAYGGICAYYCQYIPFVTGADTVEHFLSKSKYPQNAYSWQNYRFVCTMMNGRKRTYEDVLDPFLIGENWFALNFDTYMVQPGAKISEDEKKQVNQTIKRLSLNDNKCVDGRIEALKHYAILKGNMEFLWLYVPFIAYEISRQKLQKEIYDRFKYLLSGKNLINI